MKKIAVIGGGPAGMMAAISAALYGAQVTLFEKNEKLGKKLYITGKGRCNLTNACGRTAFFENIVTNPKFMYSAFAAFSNEDTMNFFEEAGLKLKTERGDRVFPASDKSSDVIKTLEKKLKESGVTVKLKTEIKDADIKGFDSVIIATGGLSYPSTGSTGDGYLFAEKIGHRVNKGLPSLVAYLSDDSFIKSLEGLSLRNVNVTVTDEAGKKLYSDFGEMLFTKEGVSGPVILSASAYTVAEISEGKRLKVSIDLKPALDVQQLDKRILRDFEEAKNKQFRNSLNNLLPSKLIPVIVELSTIDPEKKVNEINKKERAALVDLLKNFTVNVCGSEGFERAVITRGGVAAGEIDPGTMASKLNSRYYFAGEVIDTDALTGGFNIQIALSTGWLAGQGAALD
ncbi:MAG: NAD(P)/FAD-dependent oxidoreductase [Parasporobacterium sp.]|nr:NAD(P)/FAD-dependent oxidoreductase [Parasporobacterium sp.]